MNNQGFNFPFLFFNRNYHHYVCSLLVFYFYYFIISHLPTEDYIKYQNEACKYDYTFMNFNETKDNKIKRD